MAHIVDGCDHTNPSTQPTKFLAREVADKRVAAGAARTRDSNGNIHRLNAQYFKTEDFVDDHEQQSSVSNG
jgi:hypothetical protein